MNRRHERTLKAIFATPTPAAMQWKDIESLFGSLGAEITEGAGSRIRVALGGVRAVFHRPHPRNEVGRLTIQGVRAFLKNAGVEP